MGNGFERVAGLGPRAGQPPRIQPRTGNGLDRVTEAGARGGGKDSSHGGGASTTCAVARPHGRRVRRFVESRTRGGGHQLGSMGARVWLSSTASTWTR